MMRSRFLGCFILLLSFRFIIAIEGEYYEFPAGHKVVAAIHGEKVVAPHGAPEYVKKAIAAANDIVGKPYRRGGGHGTVKDTGYDCSGAVSSVLIQAGLLKEAMASAQFMNYGKPGPGEWLTVYARKGHVFLVIAGIRFDAQGEGDFPEARWTIEARRSKGSVLRHP
jgi:hypothetical protein